MWKAWAIKVMERDAKERDRDVKERDRDAKERDRDAKERDRDAKEVALQVHGAHLCYIQLSRDSMESTNGVKVA